MQLCADKAASTISLWNSRPEQLFDWLMLLVSMATDRKWYVMRGDHVGHLNHSLTANKRQQQNPHDFLFYFLILTNTCRHIPDCYNCYNQVVVIRLILWVTMALGHINQILFRKSYGLD